VVVTETVTEAQDHAKSPSTGQFDELNRMKKKSLHVKTHSQLPLSNLNKLLGKEESLDGPEDFDNTVSH